MSTFWLKPPEEKLFLNGLFCDGQQLAVRCRPVAVLVLSMHASRVSLKQLSIFRQIHEWRDASSYRTTVLTNKFDPASISVEHDVRLEGHIRPAMLDTLWLWVTLFHSFNSRFATISIRTLQYEFDTFCGSYLHQGRLVILFWSLPYNSGRSKWCIQVFVFFQAQYVIGTP